MLDLTLSPPTSLTSLLLLLHIPSLPSDLPQHNGFIIFTMKSWQTPCIQRLQTVWCIQNVLWCNSSVCLGSVAVLSVLLLLCSRTVLLLLLLPSCYVTTTCPFQFHYTLASTLCLLTCHYSGCESHCQSNRVYCHNSPRSSVIYEYKILVTTKKIKYIYILYIYEWNPIKTTTNTEGWE